MSSKQVDKIRRKHGRPRIASQIVISEWVNYTGRLEQALKDCKQEVERLQQLVANSRGCRHCWPEYGKHGTCGDDCNMLDVAALEEQEAPIETDEMAGMAQGYPHEDH